MQGWLNDPSLCERNQGERKSVGVHGGALFVTLSSGKTGQGKGELGSLTSCNGHSQKTRFPTMNCPLKRWVKALAKVHQATQGPRLRKQKKKEKKRKRREKTMTTTPHPTQTKPSRGGGRSYGGSHTKWEKSRKCRKRRIAAKRQLKGT